MTSTNTTRDRVDALLKPVEQENRREWQQCAANALATILTRAAKANLPLISWQISQAGELVGKLDTLDYGNSERLLSQAWGKWVKLLKLQHHKPVRKSGGGTHFYAANTAWMPRKNSAARPIMVIITADTFEL